MKVDWAYMLRSELIFEKVKGICLMVPISFISNPLLLKKFFNFLDYWKVWGRWMIFDGLNQFHLIFFRSKLLQATWWFCRYRDYTSPNVSNFSKLAQCLKIIAFSKKHILWQQYSVKSTGPFGFVSCSIQTITKLIKLSRVLKIW